MSSKKKLIFCYEILSLRYAPFQNDRVEVRYAPFQNDRAGVRYALFRNSRGWCYLRKLIGSSYLLFNR